MVGRTILHYKILERLGKGGMGEVWKAEDTQLRRTVALKFLSSEAIDNEEIHTRLIREAQASAALDHPNICHVYGIHEQDGETFIAMAYIDGPSLADKIKERPLPLDEALDIAIQIAEGLQEAHEKGIVHRDIKPQNVMLTKKGHVRIMDFGLARMGGRSKITKSGTTLGTPLYMSPEQLEGGKVDHRTDLWALGIVLYEIFTKRTPFEADYELAVAYGILNETPESVSSLRREVSAELDGVITKLLAKSAGERYQSAGEVLSDLRLLQDARGPAASAEKPRGPMVASAFQTPTQDTSHLVGRDRELTAIGEASQKVLDAGGRILTITGEAGIGKTSVVEAFLAQIARQRKSWLIARGQCSERLAGSEAYLPFFDALESLLGGDSAVALLMREHAPWWWVHAASVKADDPTKVRVLEEVRHITQERIKREVASFLREVSRHNPTLLFIEDLHWADVSTIDLIAYLSSRFDEMKVLIVATYRPEEMAVGDHPFLKIKPDLQSRGRCQEIRLRFLERADIEQYLALEYPGHSFPQGFVELVHRQTEGSPLFVVDLVRNLHDAGVISRSDGQWTILQSVEEIRLELPDSVKSMVERKVGELDEAHGRLLTAASVQGFNFDSCLLARVLDLDEEEVEDRLQDLESKYRFVQLIGEGEDRVRL